MSIWQRLFPQENIYTRTMHAEYVRQTMYELELFNREFRKIMAMLILDDK